MSSGRVGDRMASRRDPTPGTESPVYARGCRWSLSPVDRRSSRRRHDEEGSRRRCRTGSRSNSPRGRRRRRPRSCRSRSRTRSYECENSRCCHTRSSPHSDDREDNDEQEGSWYHPPADNEFTVRIDGIGANDGIFQCDGCFAMLSSPVYECANGDVICDRCSYDHCGEECRKCGSRELARSRAVSHLLQCIRFACKNHKYGCPTFLPRQDMDEHELSCEHEPCFCPIHRCGFSGAADSLARHLTARHGWGRLRVVYGEAVVVPVQSPTILRADDGRIFHLSCARERGGTAMSMVCIRPDHVAGAEEEFTYEVRTACQRLQMQASVESTSLRYGMKDAVQARVKVPDDMLLRLGDAVQVFVRKAASAAGAANNN
uniref:E3 ubiquitin-protein ligase n=1 Tax=Oryza punctata TaxID=4537 RepID=A0A0E0JDH6_ORYPU